MEMRREKEGMEKGENRGRGRKGAGESGREKGEQEEREGQRHYSENDRVM